MVEMRVATKAVKTVEKLVETMVLKLAVTKAVK